MIQHPDRAELSPNWLDCTIRDVCYSLKSVKQLWLLWKGLEGQKRPLIGSLEDCDVGLQLELILRIRNEFLKAEFEELKASYVFIIISRKDCFESIRTTEWWNCVYLQYQGHVSNNYTEPDTINNQTLSYQWSQTTAWTGQLMSWISINRKAVWECVCVAVSILMTLGSVCAAVKVR